MQATLPPHAELVTGLVLAGGRGHRMGGVDKGLQPFKGRPLARHVLDRLEPQVHAVLINANRHQDMYAAWGHAVLSDESPDFQGPLAGMLVGLRDCTTPWLMTVPCDTPFLPTSLVARLLSAALAQEADMALPCTVQAQGHVQWQTVFLLMKSSLCEPLRQHLALGERKIEHWVRSQRHVLVPFETESDFDNLNSLDELRAHE